MKSGIPYQNLLMEMLSIPAVSREEKLRADFLQQVLVGYGMKVKRIHNNLLVGEPDQEGVRKTILLNSHLDTVPPTDGWQSDPFSPQLINGRITGLGSNDAGASVVSMIAVFQALRAEIEEEMNLLLLISAEEEVSGENGITSVLQELGRVDGVIVGEPTGMQPAVAERGLMVVDAEVTGKAGHAARQEGVNAITLAMNDIQKISSMEFSRSSEWLPAPGAQVTMISAGNKHNVVPAKCKYVVDVRSNDRYGNEEILEMLREACVADMVPRSTRLKASWLEADHFLMEAATASGLSPFGSLTLSDMALIPFPAVKMGPGDSARSHTAEEFIRVEELDRGVEGYIQFLSMVATVMKQKSSRVMDR
ncbi:MAG: M20/M25/M40 family metallo-hydrolase [Bacteroidales bacterium]